MRALRVAIALLVLGGLIYFGVMLTPAYVKNWQLQRYVAALAESGEAARLAPDLARVRVAQKAAELGVPLDPKQVRVRQTDAGLSIDARYVVRVDLPLYTVDLHMRASAGIR